ncbi:MAG: aldo/keto reductase [Calditrichaeota bacterium]|nr:aldo/keto reductase [Calditrichota bacterium]
MKTRKLGKNGPELSVIGLGAWAIGGPWQWGWGKQDDDDSIRTIHRALDLGISWIDTAPVYGLGHSEEIVGRALKGIREKFFIATKCGLVWNSKGKIRNDLSPVSIRKEAEDSLRRLDTDYIDLFQFHWPDPNMPVEKSWETMVRLKDEGKIRYLGVSNFDVELMQRAEKIAHIDSLQPLYNMLDRGAGKEILPFCQKNGTGVVVYSPMKSGLLTGKFDAERLAADDWRRKSHDFREPKLSKNLALIDALRPFAEKFDVTVAQLAIAWVLRNEAVTSAIVGARGPDQIQETAAAANVKIEPEDWDEIDRLIEKLN